MSRYKNGLRIAAADRIDRRRSTGSSRQKTSADGRSTAGAARTRPVAWWLVLALLATPLAMVAGPALADPVIGPTLWLTDDVTNSAYHVTLDGTVISTFVIPGAGGTPNSSVSIDPADLTLWGANEKASTPAGPGQLVNYDRNGASIKTIPAQAFGATGTEAIAVTMSPRDATLWVVDAPSQSTGLSPHIYNITRDGELISSFPTFDFDVGARAPQAIAHDAYTGTLWLTDRIADKVYNITTSGALLSSFSTTGGAFAGEPLNDVQGIAVESSRVLWVTDRITDKVYRVTNDGSQILAWFAPDVTPSLGNLTGIAFDRPPGDLGAAASYAVFGQAGAELKMKDVDRFTAVAGDVDLGPKAKQNFDDGLLTGVLAVDPSASNSNEHSVVISGGTQSKHLTEAGADVAYASLAASVLAPNQSFGEIKGSKTIAGDAGLNVIEIDKIELDDSETVTLSGPANSAFVLNVSGEVKVKHDSALTVAGGLEASRVLINIQGSGDSSIEDGSAVFGTILSPSAKFKIKGNGSTLLGSLVGGREITLESGGRVRSAAKALAPGGFGQALSAAVLGGPDSKVKIDDKGSVLGDVILGPFSKQEFGNGLIDGSLIVDPLADNSRSNSVVITGGTIKQETSEALADAVDGSYAAAWLPADQVISEIKGSKKVSGGSGLNVIEVKKIELDKRATLTIVGGPDSRFVFNLDEQIKLKNGSSIRLEGGVTAENVIFNVIGDKDSAVESGSVVRGSIVSIQAKVSVKDQYSVLYGAAVSGDEVAVTKLGTIDGR